MNTINPWGMTAKEWTDAMTTTFDFFGSLPKIEAEEAWRDWATTLMSMVSIPSVVLPDPAAYADWKTWAERFNELMDGWSG